MPSMKILPPEARALDESIRRLEAECNVLQYQLRGKRTQVEVLRRQRLEMRLKVFKLSKVKR
mgnify:CR=1 FL=1